ncbi:MAG: endonuclease III [Clostridia bacterium]|jgi:endonuclease-3|nr:endonuclease III [Clostridiaceae bacterium]
MRESKQQKVDRLHRILSLLDKHYPDAKCSLKFNNPYQLLIATRLSAQTTDNRVNIVTPALFARYPTVYDMAEARLEEVEEYIKTVGIYKNKAKDLIAMSRMIKEEYGGEVPDTMEELTKLPGVGRKTASVVLGNAFGKPAIAVDTHFGRIMRRMGFTRHKDPEKVEKEMLALVPPEKQVDFCHQIINHGRTVCKSAKPDCLHCFLSEDCPKLISGK